jgi:peptide/nickel transport system substrate-binding protein
MNRQQLSSLAALGRISRREFMQLAIAAGFTVPAAARLFTSAARAQARRGGSFKAGIGHGSTTDTLDPATWTNTFSASMGLGIFGAALTETDAKNAVVPHLAESFEPADGAKKWVFKLRKGATFHNGKNVTADDVVATYNYHRAERSKSAVKSVLDTIDDVKADGSETVIFMLSSGSADFPYIASDYHLPIYPAREGGGINWEKGESAGPYVLDAFEPGVSVKAKRNPNYHKSNAAWFDEIEMLSIVDVAARSNALTAGDVHYIDRCDLKTLDLLKQDPNVRITDLTGFGHYLTPMNVTVPPFDNADVRLALKWAVNREEILKKVLLGHGTAGNDNPIAPTMKFASNPEPVHTYDPAKARFHLEKAGLSSLKIDISTADAAFAGAVDAAALMREQARACGIEINIIREPDDGYWDNVWMKKPWCLSYWGGRPTADWMFTTAYAADAAWNDTFWKHPRFNELLIAARAETDESKRAGMYAEMQQLTHTDGGIIVLMFNNFVSAHSTAVANNGEIAGNYDLDGGMIFERWWMA